MKRVNNKIALITGGASGIGETTARLLSREGAKIIITDLDVIKGERISKEIGYDTLFLEHDVSSENGWVKVIKSIEERFGKLDILVNNAGMSKPGSIETADFNLWKKTMSVNADSVFLGCKYGIELMKKSENASIINIASTLGISTSAIQTCYGASKSAVINLTKSIAIYCGEKRNNIRCNAILPGAIRTPMFESYLNMSEDLEMAEKEFASAHPMGRVGEPLEIANAILFLASDEASFITGAALPVDGGLTAA